MGICKMQFYNDQNNVHLSLFKTSLKRILLDKLKDLMTYNFHSKLTSLIPHIQPKYLYTTKIINNIQLMLQLSQTNTLIKSQQISQSIQQILKKSNFILQDQVFKNRLSKNYNNNDRSITKQSQGNAQHQKYLFDNQSLVCQINLIYKCQFDLNQYNKALKLFLKWNSIFQHHFQQGFLNPIYQQFIKSIYQLDINDFCIIVQQIVAYVQYMVQVYIDIYKLKIIHQTQNGYLFKKQNIFNLIMANLFTKQQIKNIVRQSIKIKQQTKIKKFQLKLYQLQFKNIQAFKVQPQFRLIPQSSVTINQSHDSIRINQIQKQNLLPQQPISPKSPHQSQSSQSPYSSCLKAIQDLSQNSSTPITKLKLIIQVAKGIASSIYTYYQKISSKQIPELDPQNLTCILMYLIVRANKVKLLQQLKIAQHFTTANCLNCISGYYLNTFNAAIQTLQTL